MTPHRLIYVVCALLFLSLITVACGPEEADSDAPVPTRTMRPTFTPTPVEAVSPTPEPPTNTPDVQPERPAPEQDEPAQEQPTATATPEPQSAVAVVTSPLVNVRTGPGTEYDQAGQVERGTELRIVGKNQAADWWQVCCVSDRTVWIAGFLVDTTGPVDSVAVAADIPAAPPTDTPAPVQPTAPPAATEPAPSEPTPAEPTATPAPAFTVQKGGFIEPRPNNNDIVTVFGTLCDQVCPGGGAAGGYIIVVEGPHGRSEGTFGDTLLHGDPGQASEFIYNVKIEIPGGPAGDYRAYVADPGGNQVSEAWSYTSSGNIRTFLPRWVVP